MGSWGQARSTESGRGLGKKGILMRRACRPVLAVSLVWIGLSVQAAPPAVSKIDPQTVQHLEDALRRMLILGMPEVLYEKRYNWGETTRVVSGIDWNRRGLRIRPEWEYREKKDGHWRHVKVVPHRWPQSLSFRLSNLQLHPEEQRTTFELDVHLDIHVYYRTLRWESGLRLYDASAETTLRLIVRLEVEAHSRFEVNRKSLTPELVFRLRVTRADLRYADFEMKHIAGIGGEGARLLGKGLKELMEEIRPNLEKELLAKGEAAIVKAADTREVRLGLEGITRQKKEGSPSRLGNRRSPICSCRLASPSLFGLR